MTLDKFLIYITYSNVCPSYITPYRWAGMLAYYAKHF